MTIAFDDRLGCCTTPRGRRIIRVPSDNVAKDVAILEYLLTHWSQIEYEIIPEAHSIHLLEKPRT